MKDNLKRYLFNAVVSLLPIVAVLFVYRKVIFRDAIFAHLDVINNYFPYFNSLFQSNGSMQFGIIGGYPIHLSVSTTWYSPFSFLMVHIANAFSSFVILDISFIIAAYIFTYLLCRKLGLSYISSILAGTIYIFSGQVLMWSETIIISVYYAMLPLVMICLYSSFHSKGYRRYVYVIISGLLLGVCWLVGHVQWSIFIHLAAFAYVVYLVLEAGGGIKNIARRSFAMLLVIFGISYAMGLPMLSALLNFVHLTSRNDGVGLSMMYAYSYYPYHIIHYFLPSFSIPYTSLYAQAFPNYVGIMPFILLVFGIIVYRKIYAAYPNSRFPFYCFIFCIVSAIKYSPIIFIFHYLPFLNAIREAPRMMFVGDFAIAIYVAFVLDYIIAQRSLIALHISKMALYIKRSVAYIILPIISVFSVLFAFFLFRIESIAHDYFLQHMFNGTVGGFDRGYYLTLIDGYVTQVIRQFSIFDWNVIVLLFGMVSAYLIFSRFERIDMKRLSLLILSVVILNFVFQYRSYINAFSRDDYLSLPNTVRFIKDREATSTIPFRVFSPLNGVSVFTESTRCSFPQMDHWEISEQDLAMRKELLEPNTNLLYGIDSADGYEPYIWTRTGDTQSYIGSRFAPVDRYGLQLGNDKGPAEEKIRAFVSRKNFLRSLNIKYIASYYKIDDHDFKEIFSEDIGQCKTRIYLYQLSGTWPRYFVSDSAYPMLGGDDGDKFKYYTDQLNEDGSPRILLEGVLGLQEYDNPRKDAIVREVKADMGKDSFKIKVSMDKSGYLFMGDTWLPDWHATIDGRETKIFKANYTDMALIVPKGKHIIEMRYKY